MGDRDTDAKHDYAEPGRPAAEERVRAGERALCGDPGGAHARNDAERDQAQLGRGPDESARAGDHLALGKLEESRRQRDAGDEDDKRRDHRPEAGISDLVLHRQRAQRSDSEGGDERHQHFERAPAVREQPQHTDDCAEDGGSGDVAWSRTKDQRDPDRQRRVPEYGRQRPEAASRGADLLELRDAVRGLERPALRFFGEAMDCSDLVEARRRRQPLRRFDRRRSAAGDRQEERGWEDAEARLLKPVGASNQAEALLDRIHRLTDGAERRTQVGEEEEKLLPRCRLQPRRVLRHLDRRGM